ncbi:glutamate-rich protein 3 isoform X2 [Syngnathus scovelli]|uniref:glutamate-rich protein 3 isoform X2 n=1 Tax=Syngnathus scovelli TaxID=161590 RepID=UPI0035CC07A5
MSHFNPGLISAYNSLTDKHLSGYFSSTRIRRHLQRAGLITRSGRIVPDKEYKHKILQKAHQKHVRECLAQAIFLKVLEMERLHQMEIKRKLEEFARRERVHKMKVARTKRFEEDVQMMSPHPPVGARGVRKQHSGPVGGHYASSESPCSSRPNTAPGTMQRPARLKPIRSGANKRRSARKVNQAFSDFTDRESGTHEPTAWDPPPGVSPYCLPVINNFVTPLPPATKKKNRGPGCNPSGTPSLRGGRRLRPATTFSAVDANEERSLVRISEPQSKVRVTMVYFGKSVHLSHDSEDPRDEVRVFQQHCGGENLCVYKGKLREGETFQFVSRRHQGFPFSLTFFLNGLQVERLSSCCEFKHRRGLRLGGRHGHFGFSVVERASPCYKCIIAMGLDKKPAPPPMKVQDARGSFKEARSTSHSGRESTPSQQEDKHRDDYDEDFEGDDDVAVEESNEKKAASPTGGTDAQPKDETSSDSEDHNQDEDDDTRPRSSSSSCEESDVEVVANEDEEEPKEILQAETVDEEEEQANPEDSADSESSADVDVLDSGQKEQSQETSGEKSEGRETEDESKLEQPERAKSVQEKLAEAILKESQQSSEPELSDTSTEEEETTAVAASEQGQKLEKDEAVLVEAQLEESSEPKEPAEAGQEEPHEDVKEGDSEKKMEEGAAILEPQDDTSAISVNVDPEVKPGSETTETKAEETAGGSELEATPDPSGLEMMVSPEDVKDEASGDVQAVSEEPDDPKCEEDGKKEEEQTNLQSDTNQESEKEETIEKTAEDGQDGTQEAEVATVDEAEAEESEKTETDNCEALKVKSAEDQEEKVDEVEETNEEDERENEASADKDEEAGTAQANEGEENNKATNEENEAEDRPDKDEEEKIPEAEESQETNQATTDKEESKPMEKVENEAEGLEELTNKDDEKMTTLEVKEGQELDKTTNEEESAAIEKDEREDGAKDESEKDKEIILKEEINMESEVRHKDETDKGEQKTVEDENKSEDRSVTFDPEERQESAKDSQEQEKPSEANLQNEDLNVVTETLGVFQQSSPTEETTADKVLRTENDKSSHVDGENGETSSRVDLIEEPDQIRQDLDLEKTKQTEKQSSQDPSQNLTSKTRSPGPEVNTEEASKASDEGASVLLQPQSNTQTANQLSNGESPDALARASSAELVTNWLSTHQASKLFETFVEPLEDLKDSDAGPSKEARQSSEPEEPSREEVALNHLEGEAQSYPERRPITDDWGVSKSNMAATH